MNETPADEITAEFAIAELGPSVPLRFRTKVTVAAKTDLGRVRENNEDKFEFYITEEESLLARRGQVFLVCDGMGGHAAGQIASELAAKTFIDTYLDHPAAEPTDAMHAGVLAANNLVTRVGLAIPTRRGMGTTLTALILLQDEAFLVHAGDSRMYRLRNGSLEQLSHDHTVMEEMVRNGVLTREQAAQHPQRHAILRCIGLEEGVTPDVTPFDLRRGDLFLLCSDGVTNHVSDDDLFRLMSGYSPAEVARRAVAEALAGGGSDNATVLVVRIDALDPIDSEAQANALELDPTDAAISDE